ncbi:MAG: TetR/AcrR family transcriptional regulator [Bacillota bacterium]|nr:TetR/AcrR family transcriptional regulator [Bacillota bacterium]
MPERLFYELDVEKRQRIVNAGLSEFAKQGFNEASTNSIVKIAGISKGSLFKYFSNKEDLYFFILDFIIADLIEDMKDQIPKLKGDIFEIILLYAEIEFNWYVKNPDKYKLLKRAFINDNSTMYEKTVERYKLSGDSFYDTLLEGASADGFREDKEKTVNILKWILEGFNEEYIKKIESHSDINNIKQIYVRELKEYLQILKAGIYI